MTSSNENIFALLAICAGKSPVSGEFPAQRPVTRGFDVFFDLHLNGRLSKHSWGWWLETPSRPLWRDGNDFTGASAVTLCKVDHNLTIIKRKKNKTKKSLIFYCVLLSLYLGRIYCNNIFFSHNNNDVDRDSHVGFTYKYWRDIIGDWTGPCCCQVSKSFIYSVNVIS